MQRTKIDTGRLQLIFNSNDPIAISPKNEMTIESPIVISVDNRDGLGVKNAATGPPQIATTVLSRHSPGPTHNADLVPYSPKPVITPSKPTVTDLPTSPLTTSLLMHDYYM